MAKELRFVQGEDRVLLFRFIETNDRLRDLIHEVAAAVGWFEIEAPCHES